MTKCAFGVGLFDASWQDILSGLGWGLGYFGMPHILVRFMSIEKPSMIKKSSIVAIVWVIISLLSAVLIAYFGRMIMGAELLETGSQKLVFIAMSRRFFPAAVCGLLLAAIIFRCVLIARHAQTKTDMYICVGVAAMLIFQTISNIGMCLFVMPVIGLTLPFISYGGSSLLMLFISMGLVSGVQGRSKPDWLR